VRLITQSGEGLSDAWNCGLDAARGELIAFLDSDDYYMPHKLQSEVSALMQHPAVQYVDAKMKFFLEEGCVIPRSFKPALLQSEQVGYMPGTILVRKRLFDVLGAFDPTLAIAGDMDWFARAKDARVPWRIVNDVVLHKRVHGANLSLDSRVRQEFVRVLHRSVARQREAGNAHE